MSLFESHLAEAIQHARSSGGIPMQGAIGHFFGQVLAGMPENERPKEVVEAVRQLNNELFGAQKIYNV